MSAFKPGDKVTFKIGSTVCVANVLEVPDSSAGYYSVETGPGQRTLVHVDSLKPVTGGGAR